MKHRFDKGRMIETRIRDWSTTSKIFLCENCGFNINFGRTEIDTNRKYKFTASLNILIVNITEEESKRLESIEIDKDTENVSNVMKCEEFIKKIMTS